MISCQQKFKDKHSSYVFSIPDLSPVRGYTSPNNNSLRNWHENKAVALHYSRGGWLQWPAGIVCKVTKLTSYQVSYFKSCCFSNKCEVFLIVLTSRTNFILFLFNLYFTSVVPTALLLQ